MVVSKSLYKLVITELPLPVETSNVSFSLQKKKHAKSLLASRPLETSQIKKTFLIRTHDPFITLPIRAEQANNPNGSW